MPLLIHHTINTWTSIALHWLPAVDAVTNVVALAEAVQLHGDQSRGLVRGGQVLVQEEDVLLDVLSHGFSHRHRLFELGCCTLVQLVLARQLPHPGAALGLAHESPFLHVLHLEIEHCCWRVRILEDLVEPSQILLPGIHPLFDHDVVQLLGQAGIDLEGIGKLLDVRIEVMALGLKLGLRRCLPLDFLPLLLLQVFRRLLHKKRLGFYLLVRWLLLSTHLNIKGLAEQAAT
mmetsp:Transcript_25944/g.60758  ORF Transcript_25944/g.60758 Transcript_25944/m.60758 type:complete len:232 (+) Transcript_25944:658-1353(+)